ncbi:Ig-like domain-containing protein [Vibrio europaeus]|uniref:Ig-like domain-containing protein n=1 Tax=Vibrio europaeus TaxID=300876 RepID=UPI00233F0C86|nr:Ig-like domain-containing protein [Vibrio europaeus]MDC5870573.1 Ig-like domain-containing protein [Vibrio europaeus]
MSQVLKGLLAIVVLPLFMQLFGCSEGVSSDSTLKNNASQNLERIDITTSPLNTRGMSRFGLIVGQKQTFVAVGHYSDGSSRELTDIDSNGWHSSEDTVASFEQPGLVVGKVPGVVRIYATKNEVISNTITLNVTDPVLTSLVVTPASQSIAKGQTLPLVATALYSDGSSSNVSDSVTWLSTETAIATVTPEGILSGIEVGNTTVNAMKDGIASNTVSVNVSNAVLTSIRVTPASVSIAKGQTHPLVATALYSNGSSSNVSDSVTWLSAETDIATVTAEGRLSSIEVGSTTVSAMKDGITSDPVNVEVTSAVITSIQVTPASVSIAKGQTHPLVATALYSDGSSSDIRDSVTWASAETTIATVTPEGILSGIEVGNTTVSAIKDGLTSNTVSVDITSAVLTSIAITPDPVSVVKNLTRSLVATATYSDGSTSDVSTSVTWTPVDTAIATVTPNGVLLGLEVGGTTVSAFRDGITSQTLNVNVCDDVISCNIEVFDPGAGKLFTSTPSAVYLGSIGGSPNKGIYTEPNGVGSYYKFDWHDANALCTTYNTTRLAGRTNWRLTTTNELSSELYGTYGNMYTARGWPVNRVSYWSATTSGSSYTGVRLNTASSSTGPAAMRMYVSCVSEPNPNVGAIKKLMY